MTDKEIIRVEVERMMAEEMQFYETACNEGNGEVAGSPMAYTRLQMLLSFIDSMPEEPASKELDEELEKYLKNNRMFIDEYGMKVKRDNGDSTDNIWDYEGLARHFANWKREQDKQWLAEEHKHVFAKGRESMKQQMMKDAVSAKVTGAGSKGGCILFAAEFLSGNVPACKYGDYMKLIIIKED